MKTKKGFTLVELLVVIAILAILATATIVGYTAFTKKAKLSNLESELRQVRDLLSIEDFDNEAFAIEEDGISFQGFICTAKGAQEKYKVGDYALEVPADKEDATFTATTFLLVVEHASDAELAAYAGKLVYEGTSVVLKDTENGLKAEWDVTSDTISSGNLD